jgi:hypothetical protein
MLEPLFELAEGLELPSGLGLKCQCLGGLFKIRHGGAYAAGVVQPNFATDEQHKGLPPSAGGKDVIPIERVRGTRPVTGWRRRGHGVRGSHCTSEGHVDSLLHVVRGRVWAHLLLHDVLLQLSKLLLLLGDLLHELQHPGGGFLTSH